MKLIASIGLLSMIIFYSGCTNKNFSYDKFESIENVNANKNIMLDDIEYYTTFETIKSNVINGSNNITVRSFCADNDDLGSGDLFRSFGYLVFEKNEKEIIKPFLIYQCLDSSSVNQELDNKSLDEYVLLKNNDLLNVTIRYLNYENKDKTDDVNKLIDIVLKYSTPGVIGEGISLAGKEALKQEILLKAIKLVQTSDIKDSSKTLEINSSKIANLEIKGEILNSGKVLDDKSGIIYNFKFVVKPKITLTKAKIQASGYPDFSPFIRPGYLLYKNDTFIIGDKEYNDGTKIYQVIDESISMDGKESLNSRLSALNINLENKKYNQIDRALILYLSFLKSKYYSDHSSDIKTDEGYRKMKSFLDFLNSENNILHSFSNLFKNLNIPYNDIIVKTNNLINDYENSDAILSNEMKILSDSKEFVPFLNSIKSRFLTRDDLVYNPSLKIINNNGNEESINIDNFLSVYNDFLIREVIENKLIFKSTDLLHGCYMELYKDYNSITTQNQIISALSENYTYMIFQHDKITNKNRIIFFRGNFVGNKLIFSKILIDDNYINNSNSITSKNFLEIVNSRYDPSSQCIKSINEISDLSMKIKQ